MNRAEPLRIMRLESPETRSVSGESSPRYQSPTAPAAQSDGRIGFQARELRDGGMAIARMLGELEH